MDGELALALMAAGLTEEEIAHIAKRPDGLKHNAVVWFNNPAPWTYAAHLFTSDADPDTAVERCKVATHSSLAVVVMVKGKVPRGACVPPEWRD